MKPILRTALLTMLAASPLLITLACAARIMSSGRPEFSARDWGRLVGLSKAQEDRLAAALKEERTSMQPLIEKQRQALQLLSDQLEDGAPEADLESTLAELNLARTAARSTEEDFKDRLSTFLTPMQRAKMLVETLGRRERQIE